MIEIGEKVPNLFVVDPNCPSQFVSALMANVIFDLNVPC